MRAATTGRKAVVLVASIAIGAVLLAAFLLRELETMPKVTATRPNVADDMSRMDATGVRQLWDVPSEESAAEASLRDLLRRARTDRLHVSIAGASHSMG